MKKTILFLLIGFSGFSQTAVYNKTTKSGLFEEYQTKTGNILKLGDTINILLPRQGNEFTFITQGDFQVSSHLSNTKIPISKIKSVGNKKRGHKIYLGFKGFGSNCFIDYESALEVGEIKNPFTN